MRWIYFLSWAEWRWRATVSKDAAKNGALQHNARQACISF